MTAEASDTESLIEVHRDGHLARVTLGQGAKHNAVTAHGWTTLKSTIDELGQDEDIRVIVLRGRDGTFCAGSDMTEWVNAELDTVEDSFAQMESAFRTVEQCPVPVVAEIHGVAAGAGCQLALAYDLRYMASSARIGMPIARLGILATPSFAARLVTLAGPATARQLLYTGCLLHADSAVAAGLADYHLPAGELTEYVEDTVVQIANQPPKAIEAAKHAVSAALSPIRETTRHSNRSAVSPTDFPSAISALLD